MDGRQSGTGGSICQNNATVNISTSLLVNINCDKAQYNNTCNDTDVYFDHYNIFGDVDPDALHGCLQYSFVIETIIIGLACILGLVGNSLAQWVFWKDNIQTASLLVFRCILISDSVVLIESFPHLSITALVYLSGWFPEYFDVLPYILAYVYPLAFMAHVCSVWFSVLIGYCRYLTVVHPHIPRISVLKRVKKYIVAVLVAVAVYCVPKFFEFTVYCLPLPCGNTCVPILIPSIMATADWYNIVYRNIMYAVFMTVLPQGTMIYHYTKVLMVLRSSSTQSKDRDDHVARAIVFVITSTIVSQTPALVAQILLNSLPHTTTHCGGVQFYLGPISNALIVLNSTLSFPVHYVFNSRFRELIGNREVDDPVPESHSLVIL